jgi:hypothetical protein
MLPPIRPDGVDPPASDGAERLAKVVEGRHELETRRDQERHIVAMTTLPR